MTGQQPGQQPGQDPEQPGWQAPMPPPPEFQAGQPGEGGYGGYAGYPPGPPPAPPAAPPSILDTAWWLVIATAVLGVIQLIYSVSHRDELVDRVIRDRELSLEEAESAANLGITVGVLLGLGFTIFYIFLAMKIRAGRNWARITLTVFLVLGVLGGLASLGGDNASLAKTLGGLGLILDATILVLIWLPASSAYIAARSRRSW